MAFIIFGCDPVCAVRRDARLGGGAPIACLGLAVTLVALAGCSGINLGDSPGPDVAKQTGPLTAPPAHLQSGRE